VEKEQSDAIRRELVNAMRNRTPLVYGRDWEYKPVTVPPDQAQFINAMQLNATQIAAIFGVPPHRVGGTRGDSMTYSNVESEQLGFVQDSLDPWLVRLETALNDCLPAAQCVQFDREARLRMTPENRFAVYRAARDIGAMNVNEIRRKENLPPLPKPKDPDDYDGTDFTPLQIQVAAARGLKEIIGEGTSETETNPAAMARPKAPGPQAAPMPAPVPAVNGSNGNGNGRKPAG
jgi:phage portal protein BeeE